MATPAFASRRTIVMALVVSAGRGSMIYIEGRACRGVGNLARAQDRFSKPQGALRSQVFPVAFASRMGW